VTVEELIAAAAGLYQLGRYAEAEAAAQRALELAPDAGAAHITAALVAGALHGWEIALGRLDAFATRVPGDAAVTSARAYALLRLGRYIEALDAAERGLAARPDFGGLLEALGCAQRALGRFDEAAVTFDRAIALGHNPAAMLVLKGAGLLETGAIAEARATLERALELDPANAEAWLALGDVRAYVPGDPALAHMEALLAGAAGLRGEQRTLVHFALGGCGIPPLRGGQRRAARDLRLRRCKRRSVRARTDRTLHLRDDGAPRRQRLCLTGAHLRARHAALGHVARRAHPRIASRRVRRRRTDIFRPSPGGVRAG
jgi:Flp pilus assembly protein TadD